MKYLRYSLTILLVLLATALYAANLRMSVINVGQGDSILVDFPSGQHMLVDAGPSDAGPTVVSYLRSHQVKKIDILVVTHPHEDHIGGMDDVLAAFPVGKVWDSGYNHGSHLQREYLQTIKAKRIPFGMPRAGSSYTMGNTRVAILAPVQLLSGTDSDANNNSLVMRISYGKTSFLLTGDMEGEERATVSNWPRSTVLKVSHHGSHNGTDSAFAQAVHPQYAAISYAVGNSYGHPHQEAISALSAIGTKLYSTGQQGTVVITSDGQRVSVSTAGKRATGGGSRAAVHHHGGGGVAVTSAGGNTVYITKTGECYHRTGCDSLRRSCIAISRKDAIARGYRPCSRCRP
jgi:competence protein ComEC